MSSEARAPQIGFARWGKNGMESSVQNVPGDTSGAWRVVYLADRAQYDPSQFIFRYELRDEVIYEIVDGPIQFDYREARRQAYPDIGDQLDAIWKGGAALESMRAAILAVKTEFPKPQNED